MKNQITDAEQIRIIATDFAVQHVQLGTEPEAFGMMVAGVADRWILKDIFIEETMRTYMNFRIDDKQKEKQKEIEREHKSGVEAIHAKYPWLKKG